MIDFYLVPWGMVYVIIHIKSHKFNRLMTCSASSIGVKSLGTHDFPILSLKWTPILSFSPGKKVEIKVVFRPDHPSDLYSDVARIQLFGKQEAHAIRLRGVAKTKIMFVKGLDEIFPNVESLTVLPGPEEEEGINFFRPLFWQTVISFFTLLDRASFPHYNNA